MVVRAQKYDYRMGAPLPWGARARRRLLIDGGEFRGVGWDDNFRGELSIYFRTDYRYIRSAHRHQQTLMEYRPFCWASAFLGIDRVA